MSDNLGTLRKRAELPNALHGCTSDPCGSVVCQTARDRDELLSRLEQVEQDRFKLRNRLDAMRRQRDGYQAQARKAEQAVARVREMHSVIPVKVNFDEFTTDYCDFCGDQEYPCPTIRALDGDTRADV